MERNIEKMVTVQLKNGKMDEKPEFIANDPRLIKKFGWRVIPKIETVEDLKKSLGKVDEVFDEPVKEEVKEVERVKRVRRTKAELEAKK